MKKTGLLDLLAEQHRTFISNLRLLPELLLLELLPEPLSELQPVLLLERKRFLFLLQ